MSNRSVNQVTVLGTMGRDAETKQTQGGTSVSTFSLATNRRWKDKESGDWKEEVDWINCVLWRGERVAEYLLKGRRIYLQGRLHTRNYEKDGRKIYVTEVIVDNLILLGDNNSNGGPPPSPPPVSQPRQQQTTASVSDFPADDDGWGDIPF